jgi:predicted ATPase
VLASISLEEANGTGHELSICLALKNGACIVGRMRRDLAEAEWSIARLGDVANSISAQFWQSAARFLEGKLLIERGDFATGSALLRSELDTSERIGWNDCYPEFLGTLAEALAGLRRFPEALATVEQAIENADQGGERYYVAELFRLKGEFLLAESDEKRSAAVDECF